MQGNVAKRYAKALFRACEPTELDGAQAALHDLTAAWEENVELRESLFNPGIPYETKLEIAADVAALITADDRIRNLFSVLVENRRLAELPAIANQFDEIVTAFRQALALEIATASEVTAAEKDHIQGQIRTEFGNLASIDWKTDPSLIGGMVIKAGDRLLDGSVRGSLERMRSALLRN